MKNTPPKLNSLHQEKSPDQPKQGNGHHPAEKATPRERAVTDTKQPDHTNQPIRKTDPSRYTEEE